MTFSHVLPLHLTVLVEKSMLDVHMHGMVISDSLDLFSCVELNDDLLFMLFFRKLLALY